MAYTILDGAGEFRIEIAGKFVGACVPQVEQRWHQALDESLARTITVDISRISDYDHAGRKLLRSMYQHGTNIAASTPRSLVFLSEITSAQRRGSGLEVVQPTKAATPKKAKSEMSRPKTAFAAGGSE